MIIGFKNRSSKES